MALDIQVFLFVNVNMNCLLESPNVQAEELL